MRSIIAPCCCISVARLCRSRANSSLTSSLVSFSVKFSIVCGPSCNKPSISCRMRERLRFRLRTGMGDIVGAVTFFSSRRDLRGLADCFVRAILEWSVGGELRCDLILIISESSYVEISW
jgi:hypothetical protein